MNDYIDETPLTDEEVAAAIAEAKAKKAERKKNSKRPHDDSSKSSKSLDEKSSSDLLNESSSAALLEEEEDESPAVKSAKSFSDAFAAAKKKREADLQQRSKSVKTDEDDSDFDDEDETTIPPDSQKSVAAAVSVDDDDDEYEYEDENEDEEDDDENSDESSDDEYEYEDDDDSDEYEYEDDEDSDDDGIFETDDENGEYTTAAAGVKANSDDDDDSDDDNEEEEDSAFSTKAKMIIGIVIAVLVIAIICAVAFFMKSTGGKPADTSSVVSVADGDVTSVKFAESSISIKVGETASLKLIVEPENAVEKTFKLKSNDETIAKVTEEGKIIGIASGSTTITATLKSNPAMTASLVVNVIDEEQSALNTFNNFVNMIVDGSTDIDSDSETDTTEEENDEENTEESDTESDTDSEVQPHGPSHVLTGNKIEDFDSDGELELALYYQPNTDNEEPLVRIFKMMSEEEETKDSEEDENVMYDEFGNVIEQENTDSDTESDTASDSDTDKAPAEKKLTELDQYSDLYMTMHSAIEADSAASPWNTSYMEIKEEETGTARVKILSSGYSAPTYLYESENEEIATVDKQGNIKGIKPGTTFITVSSPLNSDAVAKIKVRIKDDTDLLDDYLADIPAVNSTNDAVFPTETLTGKAIVDIDNDGVSELLLRFRYSENVETVNIIKVENEKCVCYKTYNNLSDLYEYNDGNGSYSNSILVHYTTGKVCLQYKGIVAKEGSKSKTSEEKILTLENSGSFSELVNFRTTTDISTKTVTSEVIVDNTSSVSTSSEDENTDSEETTYYDNSDEDSDTTESTVSHIDEDGDGYDDITDEYFGSFAAFTFDEIVENHGIDMTNKKPVKMLPQTAGAPDDEDDDEYYDDDNNDNDNDNDSSSAAENNDDDEPVTSTVTTEVSEETTKYFVNGTPVDQSVYEEVLTRYSATYSVWNAWESV